MRRAVIQLAMSGDVIRRASKHSALFVGAILIGGCTDSVAPSAKAESLAVEPNAASVAATYSVQDLSTFPFGSGGEGFAINAAGDVAGAGHTSGQVHAALFTGTSAIDLGVPIGYSATVAVGVNDSRTIAGVATDPGRSAGFIWKSGTFTMITAPPPSDNVNATALNNADVVVGHYMFSPGIVHAFRYSTATGFVDIHPGGIYVQSFAYGISDEGIVAGSVEGSSGQQDAAIWSPSNVVTDIGNLGGLALALGINRRGSIVVGWYADAATFSRKPFQYSSATGMVGLGIPGVAAGVSDPARIVGYSLPPNVRAATRKGSGQPFYLPMLTGTTRAWARAVNRCGTIAGAAADASGSVRPVRWNISTCD